MLEGSELEEECGISSSHIIIQCIKTITPIKENILPIDNIIKVRVERR